MFIVRARAADARSRHPARRRPGGHARGARRPARRAGARAGAGGRRARERDRACGRDRHRGAARSAPRRRRGPQGYGLGFTADVPLDRGVRRAARARVPDLGRDEATADGRSWRAVQVHGLLPDPFPLPGEHAHAGRDGPRDRGRRRRRWRKIPAVAKAATRKAGGSMVVVTEYGFDAAAWRARRGRRARRVLGRGRHRRPRLVQAPARARPARSCTTTARAGVRRIVARGRRRLRSRSATSRSSSARRRDRQRARLARAQPRRRARPGSSCSISDSPRCDPGRARRPRRARSPPRARAHASSCARGAITIPSSSPTTTSPGETRTPPNSDRPADARRDVARPAIGTVPRAHSGRSGKPAAVAHVAVDDDPAQPAPPRLGGQQLAERRQRRARRPARRARRPAPPRRSRTAPRGTRPPRRRCTPGRTSRAVVSGRIAGSTTGSDLSTSHSVLTGNRARALHARQGTQGPLEQRWTGASRAAVDPRGAGRTGSRRASAVAARRCRRLTACAAPSAAARRRAASCTASRRRRRRALGAALGAVGSTTPRGLPHWSCDRAATPAVMRTGPRGPRRGRARRDRATAAIPGSRSRVGRGWADAGVPPYAAVWTRLAAIASSFVCGVADSSLPRGCA